MSKKHCTQNFLIKQSSNSIIYVPGYSDGKACTKYDGLAFHRSFGTRVK